MFRQTFPDASVRVLAGADASREALVALAPGAHYLHVATHGFFGSESVRSWRDGRDPDAPAVGGTAREGGRIRGFAPLLLCGLAFAGANRTEDSFGRVEGVLTGEEVASLDLAGCELAVLSGCDTAVGVRRGGQGIASLQLAVHAAGARAALTSLWRVSDEAAR